MTILDTTDPMAPVLRALYAERQTGMPADFHNPRRDLLQEIEKLRRGTPPHVADRGQKLIDEVDQWEVSRRRRRGRKS